MEQKNFPFLRNWNLSAHNDDIIIKGAVYGHAHIADSRKIKTSPVQKVAFSRESWERLYFYTHNTVYECPLNQVDPTCQFTKKYLMDRLPEEQICWEKWLDDDPTRPETPFENVELPVGDGAYLLALDADSPHLFQGVYQKFGNKYHWIIRRPYVNMGMFTDSVLSNKYDDQLNLLFDVRYFPQGVQELRFYGIRFGGENILFYVVNVGNSNIIYDGKNLESWHYFQLLEKTQEELADEPTPQDPPPAPTGDQPAFRIQEENRPTLPSRLLNSPYYAENPPDLSQMELVPEELPNQLSLFQNNEAPEEFASSGEQDEMAELDGQIDFDAVTQYLTADPVENYVSQEPGEPQESEAPVENYVSQEPGEPEECEAPVENYVSQESGEPEESEAPVENYDPEYPVENYLPQEPLEQTDPEAPGDVPEESPILPESGEEQGELPATSLENQENQEETAVNEPRKSLLEEALEFEKNSIPPKRKVELHDEEESREQVLFSSLALYGSALEEIPLESNENGQEVETFNEVPALNLEFFPEEDQENIAQLNLGNKREYEE